MTTTTTDNETTASASDSPASATKPRVGARRTRRLLAVFAVALMAFGTVSVASSAPASAASGMSICLKTRTGLTVTGVGVFSEIYYAGAWYPTQLKLTDGFNGCVTFYLSGVERNYPVRIRVPSQQSGSNTIWLTTGWLPAGSTHYNFGRVSPNCLGFCYGY